MKGVNLSNKISDDYIDSKQKDYYSIKHLLAISRNELNS